MRRGFKNFKIQKFQTILIFLVFRVSDYNVKRCVYIIGDVFTAFLALFYALCQKVFYLSVDRAEIVFSPSGKVVVKFF